MILFNKYWHANPQASRWFYGIKANSCGALLKCLPLVAPPTSTSFFFLLWLPLVSLLSDAFLCLFRCLLLALMKGFFSSVYLHFLSFLSPLFSFSPVCQTFLRFNHWWSLSLSWILLNSRCLSHASPMLAAHLHLWHLFMISPWFLWEVYMHCIYDVSALHNHCFSHS